MLKVGFRSVIPLNPISPGVGGGGLRGSNAKNQCYHQPIKMKLCMHHYNHKIMPDAKVESGSFYSFGNMTSQNFSLKRGTSDQFRIFTPGKPI